MSKVTLTEVLGINDPMLNDNFELTFTKVPGGGADGRQMRLQCRSGVKPGMSIQEVEIELFGHKVKHAARKVFSGSMSVGFVESYEGRITQGLEAWAEMIRGTDTQSGSFKRDYATTAVLNIFDQTGAVSLTYNIYNVWPTQVPDYSFDGAGGSAIQVDVEFAYDYYERA